MAELNLFENRLELKCNYEEKGLANNIIGHRWNRTRKSWTYPVNVEAYNSILKRFKDIVIESNALEAVNKIIKKEKELLVIKRLDDIDIDKEIKVKSKLKLFKHQKVTMAFLLKVESGMLADELGVGKTAPTILTAIHYKEQKKIDKCIIVCPATTKFSVWESEIEKFTHEKSIIINGNKKERIKQYNKFFNDNSILFMVINYALLRGDLNEKFECNNCKKLISGFGKPNNCPKCKKNNLTYVGDLELSSRLKQLELMVTIDESIKIKNRKSLQAKAVKSIPAKYKIAISGYPVANKLVDIWSQFDWFKEGLLGNYWSFEDRYLVKNHFNAIVGNKNMDILKSKIDPYYVRRLKENVLDLPPKVYMQRDVELVGKQASAYKQMKEDLMVLIESMDDKQVILEAPTILTQMMRLSQISAGFLSQPPRIFKPIWFDNSAKFTALDEIVEEVIANNKKIVIWARFVAMTIKIAERYEKYNSDYIDGSIPSLKRKEIIGNCNKGDLNVLALQMQTCSMGVNLTGASTEVFTDLAFISPSDYVQAQERLHRPGQTNKVTIINLIAKNTIDEFWFKALSEKQKVADMLITDHKSLTKNVLMEMLK